ncbi:hypothetical protein [Gordonia sp. HS-NH1]|uniref:hypothetical protein n=1 Tax=Gordonia sp. HS-NH1 TaxID=1435068 RepID=UPI0006E32E86|nr:hypothetical protein [Gordonia sp. HS-NH1]
MYSVVGALLTCGIACTPAPEPSPPSSVQRPTIPYSVQWSAADGIDIQDRPAELIRATFDGGEMAAWAGVAHSFPGYADAVAGTRDYFGNWGRPDQPPTPGNRIPVANTVMSRHIASMTVTDTAVTARICTLRQAVKPAYPPAADAEGSFIGEARPRTLEVQLRKPSGVSAGTSGHRDESAANHNFRGNDQPSWNVFGNWSIGAIRDLRGVNDFWGDEPECVAWWRKKFPGWTGTTSLDFQPPHPVNGPWEWYNLLALDPPAPPSFPEWIAPKGADA